MEECVSLYRGGWYNSSRKVKDVGQVEMEWIAAVAATNKVVFHTCPTIVLYNLWCRVSYTKVQSWLLLLLMVEPLKGDSIKRNEKGEPQAPGLI
jgi:hypothetical protein